LAEWVGNPQAKANSPGSSTTNSNFSIAEVVPATGDEVEAPSKYGSSPRLILVEASSASTTMTLCGTALLLQKTTLTFQPTGMSYPAAP
tara:strand:- start:4115 stop:4381 length:267 start_codon:yes stop_codon:yes gene_type:complete